MSKQEDGWQHHRLVEGSGTKDTSSLIQFVKTQLQVPQTQLLPNAKGYSLPRQRDQRTPQLTLNAGPGTRLCSQLLTDPETARCITMTAVISHQRRCSQPWKNRIPQKV